MGHRARSRRARGLTTGSGDPVEPWHGELGDDPVDVGLGTGASTTSILTGSGLSIAAERCVRVNLPGKSVTLLATGTWQGQVAAVWVAEVTGARVAFVSDLSSCTILYSLRL